MRESWRWFGPKDPVTLDDIRQTGATDLVSALHDVPIGEPWPLRAIQNYRALIEKTPQGLRPLQWSVVESIPVHEDIKLAKPGHEKYVQAWIDSMSNLAQCGIRTICYNFMPVIDWTRTDLRFRLDSGAYALRFDFRQFAAFDLYLLERKDADKDYSPEEIDAAKSVFRRMSDVDRDQLVTNIIAGLPGRMTESYGLAEFRKALARYEDIGPAVLRDNLCAFLARVLPVAEELGVRLAIHPDDPPRSMLGLPRIVCTAADLDELFSRLPSRANGMTLCVGTYGSRPDNNLPDMARQFADRIHFAHLRGVKRDPDEQRSFVEADHLDSDIDMIAVIGALLQNEAKGHSEIFFRPDHGHQMMGDLDKPSNPGYSAIGRLKGLAELRGAIKALSHAARAGRTGRSQRS